MALSLFLIVLGFVLLIAGGEVLLRGAVGLATLARLTPAVIGLTVVAAGTSVPELAVSMIAAYQGSTDITVGNVVGSNIFNVLAILGLAALLRPLTLSGNTVRLEYPVLALVTLLCVVICEDGLVSRLDATLFIAIYIGFTVYLLSLVRQQVNEVEASEFRKEVGELTSGMRETPRLWVCVVFLAVGVALLAGGAHAVVTGAVDLARQLGMTERVIGLTIVAIGTGLPEVVTSLVSAYRGRDDIAIGNIIGSNLFNILGTLGLSAMASPLQVAPAISGNDNWWMLGVTLLLFPLMFTGRRINRWEGCLLLLVYAVYMALLLEIISPEHVRKVWP